MIVSNLSLFTYLLSLMNITLEELLEAGVHFGHQIKRWNPHMAPYIYATNDGVHIFDLSKTREALIEACEAVTKTIQAGGIILFVGTKRQAKDIIADSAKRVSMPYITTRWLGGVLTNFEQIRRSVKKLEDMKKASESGEYDSNTKLERLLIDRDIVRLERMLGGLGEMKKMPEMVFILDTHEEATAVKEANRMKVPIIGVVDTNANPSDIDYPIPANDDAVKAISLVVNCIEKAVEVGKGGGVAEIVKEVKKVKKVKVEEPKEN